MPTCHPERDAGGCAAAAGWQLDPWLTMHPEAERNLGEQPMARIMREHNLKPHDLVAISSVEMTHKMVSRACKGRRLTPNTQSKVREALNRATGKSFSLRDLFNY
jgi:hypothetical protein